MLPLKATPSLHSKTISSELADKREHVKGKIIGEQTNAATHRTPMMPWEIQSRTDIQLISSHAPPNNNNTITAKPPSKIRVILKS